MTDTVLDTKWEVYHPQKHSGQGGNYILLLTAFDNAPYYTGVAKNFVERFGRHRALFYNGGRTFMRQPFIDGSKDRSHTGFAARWHDYTLQGAEEQRELVWVPTQLPDHTMGGEGKDVWDSKLKILVSLQDSKLSCPVEGRVQLDIKAYYEGLLAHPISWKIPNTRSQLMGRSSKPGPTMTYALDGGNGGTADLFFRQLERL